MRLRIMSLVFDCLENADDSEKEIMCIFDDN